MPTPRHDESRSSQSAIKPVHTNQLLDALSASSREQILTHCRPVTLPLRSALEIPHLHSRNAYFLTSGIASVVVATPNGGSAEVLVIGREGLVGAIALLGPSIPSAQCFIQLPATALEIPMDKLKCSFTAAKRSAPASLKSCSSRA